MELIVAFTIMLILTTMAVPLARSKVRAQRERDLRRALDEIRHAIDKYKDYADAGQLGPLKQGTNGYPESLDQLVEGVKLSGPKDQKIRFLRRVPKDPFTGNQDWGLRSDVYLTLIAAPETAHGSAVIGMAVEPLASWLWIGGGIMGLGTILALVPGRRRRPTAPVSEQPPADPVEEPVLEPA